MAAAWYVLVAAFFAAWAALDGFDLGVGIVFPFLRGTDRKEAALRAIGPVWNGNEVWLVAAVGSLLAAFPPVYAALLSGLYVPVVLFLLGIVGRGVALEFRGRAAGPAGRAAGSAAFSLGSFLVVFLAGVATAEVVRGLPIDATGTVLKSSTSVVNAHAIAGGALAVTLAALQGLAWLRLKTVRPGESPRAARAWLMAASALPVAGIVTIAVFRYPVLLPSRLDPGFSLTVTNAAAGERSLALLLAFAGIGVPIVAFINIVLYRTFRGGARPTGTLRR